MTSIDTTTPHLTNPSIYSAQLNMQAAYLISAKAYTEKQVGMLFFMFGMSQFLCMAPFGYLLDYSNDKIKWVSWACMAIAALTIITALTAGPFAENVGLMIILKILQGGISSILPPGFNSITLGIVGSTGFTHQVSRNRMMNHIGTALVVAIGSLIAYFLYPTIGHLFIVSPLAAIGVYYNLRRIKPHHVNADAARGLIVTSPTMTEYEHMDDENEAIWIAKNGSQAEPDDSNDMCDSMGCVGTSQSYVPPDLLREEEEETATSPTGDGFGGIPQSRSADNIYVSTEFINRDSSNYTPNRTGRGIGRGGVAVNPLQREPSNTSTLTPNEAYDYGDQGVSESSKANMPTSKGSYPSFNFGWGGGGIGVVGPKLLSPRRAQSPLAVFMDRALMTFSAVVFFFHLANSSVLPLVMQSLALQDPQAGILLSSLCIVIAQGFMAFFAKLCGDYSPTWGRKNLTLVGLFSLTMRCFLLTFFVSIQDEMASRGESSVFLKSLILSTQLLDSVGAGIFGTLHVLITNDISNGTGRFSLMLGITTGAMCLGGTVSGYIGQALAQDYGYPAAFSALGIMSLIPFFMFLLMMGETLPDFARPKPNERRKRLLALLQRLNNQRKNLAAKFGARRRTDAAKEGLAAQDQSSSQQQEPQPSQNQQHQQNPSTTPGVPVLELV